MRLTLILDSTVSRQPKTFRGGLLGSRLAWLFIAQYGNANRLARKRVTARLRMNFPGENNGLPRMALEIIRQHWDEAPRRNDASRKFQIERERLVRSRQRVGMVSGLQRRQQRNWSGLGALRGGSWATNNRLEMQSSYRNVVDRNERDVIYGFRCVLAREASAESKQEWRSPIWKITLAYGARTLCQRLSEAGVYGPSGDGAPAWSGRPWYACGHGTRAGAFAFALMAGKCVS